MDPNLRIKLSQLHPVFRLNQIQFIWCNEVQKVNRKTQTENIIFLITSYSIFLISQRKFPSGYRIISTIPYNMISGINAKKDNLVMEIYNLENVEIIHKDAVEIAKIAEECGISALAIHGRTREQFYSGKADWDIIAEIKQAINIPVIGNGDVFEVEDAVNMLEKTKCDAIMIGRGAQGNPWIFNRINHYMKTGEILPEPTLEEKITTAIRHMNLAVAEHGDYVAVREMRKHIGWYLKGLKNSAKYRDQINKITDYKEVITMLEEYMQHSLTQIG